MTRDMTGGVIKRGMENSQSPTQEPSAKPRKSNKFFNLQPISTYFISPLYLQREYK